MKYDTEKIIKEYIEGKSMNRISIEMGINIGIVYRIIKKSGIKTRTVSEAVNLTLKDKDDVVLSETTKEILIGNLLGDGSIRQQRKRAHYSHIDKNKEYLEWLKSIFEKDGITFTEIYRIPNGCYALQSHTFSAFNEFKDRFYIGSKRIVPPDIKLTPIVLRQWYISDGSTNIGKGITIAKEVDNPEPLLNELKRIFGEASYQKGGKFYIRKELKDKFFDYIGEPPVKCYSYKWV